jgi:Fe2+ or Zn2+ uptake regulation protein
MTEKEMIDELSSRGHRITYVRREIIKCLYDYKEEHSFFDFVKHFNAKDKKLNKSSIYNTLDLLINECFIHAYITGTSKTIHYKLIDENNAYITFRECSSKNSIKISVLDEDIINLITSRYNIDGFTNIKVEIIKNKC